MDKDRKEKEAIKKGVKVFVKCVAGAAIFVGGATIALPILGFGSSGIIAGSVAAGVQSTIGNVVAGSLFASMQSAGVVGMAAGTQAAIGAAGASAALASHVVSEEKQKREKLLEEEREKLKEKRQTLERRRDLQQRLTVIRKRLEEEELDKLEREKLVYLLETLKQGLEILDRELANLE